MPNIAGYSLIEALVNTFGALVNFDGSFVWGISSLPKT
jgi:hypothetical protein